MSKGFSEEEVAQFQETFNMYDADGGGKWLHHRRRSYGGVSYGYGVLFRW